MKNEKLTFNSREEFREYTTKVLLEELKTILLEAEENDYTDEKVEIIKTGLDRGRNLPQAVIDFAFGRLSDQDVKKILAAHEQNKTVILSNIERSIDLALKNPEFAEIKEPTEAEKIGPKGLESVMVDPGRGGEFSKGGGEAWSGELGYRRRKRDFAKVYSAIFGGEPIEKILTTEEVEDLKDMGPDNYKKFVKWVEDTKKAEEFNAKNPDNQKTLPVKPKFIEKIFANVNVPAGELQRFKPTVYPAAEEPGSPMPFSTRALAFKEREPFEYKALTPGEQEIPPVLIDPLLHRLNVDLSRAEEAQYRKMLSNESNIMNNVANLLLSSGIKPEEKRREVVVYDKDSGKEEYVDMLGAMGADVVHVVDKFPQLLRSNYPNLDAFLRKNYRDEVGDVVRNAVSKYRFEIDRVRPKPVKDQPVVQVEEDEKTKYLTQEDVAKALGISRSLVSEIEDLAVRKIDKLRNLAFNKVVKSKQLEVADLVTDFMVENDEALSFPEDEEMSDEEIGEVNELMFREFLKFMIDKGFVGQYLPDLIADVFTKISAFGFKKGKTFTDPKKTIKDIMLNIEKSSTYLEDFEGVASAMQRDIDALKKQKPGKLPGEKELRDEELAVLNAKKDALLILGTLLSNSKLVEVITTEYDAVKDLYENSLEAAAAIKNAYEQLEVEAEEGFFEEDPSLIDYKFDLTEADYRERLSDAILSYISSGEQGLYGLREKISADLVKSVLKPKTDDEAWEKYVAGKKEDKRSRALRLELERQAMEREGEEALGIQAFRKKQKASEKAAETAKGIMSKLLAKK
jgi:transcriptional regulator with XRE-family HTH domain